MFDDYLLFSTSESNLISEYIMYENNKIGLCITRQDYMIEHDFTLKGDDTGTIIVSWKKSNERVLIIPNVKDDEVIQKYNLKSNFIYFILRFEGEILVEFGGIRDTTFDTYFFQKSDFDCRSEHEKPYVLQAPIVALYAPGLYVKGLRELGYNADQMCNAVGENANFIEEEPDFDLEMNKASTKVCRARTLEFMIYALKKYDIMHFHSNWSLLMGGDRLWNMNSDMPYIKKMGKKIVCSYWGICDHTLGGEENYHNWHSECNICKRLKPLLCQNARYNRAILITKENADLLFTNGRGKVKDTNTRWMDNPINIEQYKPEIKQEIPSEYIYNTSHKIKIFHAFGNGQKREDVKGTQFVKAAVERLQEEGYDVDLMYFDNVPHKVLKYYQIQADIVVDQLYVGWHGSNGVECLALGLPVITYINPEVSTYIEQSLFRTPPIISAMPNTIYDVLKDLLDNPEMLNRMRSESREYAVKYHDYKVVAKQLSKLYDEIYRK